MRALDHKLWRDLWNLKGQAAAISLVIACGIAIYIMFLSTLDSLELSRASFYDNYRFAQAQLGHASIRTTTFWPGRI